MIFGEGPIIKNIAGDLNKLFLQGSRANQPIINVEGDAAADQGTADLLAAMDPVIQEISVGMSGEQSARYTVSGTPPLSLPNSLGKPLKAWSVDLLPYQEGTGDPSPDNIRQIHGTNQISFVTTGKNLLNLSASKAGVLGTVTQGNVTVTYNADGTLRLQSDASTRVDIALYDATYLLKYPNGTYTFTIYGNESVANYIHICASGAASGYNGAAYFDTATSATTTVLDGTKPWNYFFLRIFAGGSFDVVVSIQAEVGSTSTPYTPYIAPSQTVLTLPSTVYNGTVGSEGGESRDVVYDMGDLNWYKSETGDGRFYVSNLATPYGIGLISMWCEQYKPDGVGSQQAGYYGANNTIRYWRREVDTSPKEFYVVDERFNDANDFKTAVTGVKLVCSAVTPQTFPLTAPTIPTPKGTATTWATAEDGTVDEMSVTYVGKA